MVEAILMDHSEMDAGPAIANSTKKDVSKSGKSERFDPIGKRYELKSFSLLDKYPKLLLLRAQL